MVSETTHTSRRSIPMKGNGKVKVNGNAAKRPRGRPTIFGTPLTGAQRVARSRENHRARGEREFLVRLRKPQVKILETLATAFKATDTEMLNKVIEMGLGSPALTDAARANKT